MILVVANGNLEPGEWLQTYLQRARLIVAANGGAKHLHRLGFHPDILVGDLDSLPAELAVELAASKTEIHRHSADKDETDLELALLHVTATIHTEILVVGAFGGRLDQTLANVFLLAHPLLARANISLITRYERTWLLNGPEVIRGQAGDRVSLIALGGDAYIQETENLRWPLVDEKLAFGPARGVSNLMTADVAKVVVRAGQVLCIHTSQEWQR